MLTFIQQFGNAQEYSPQSSKSFLSILMFKARRKGKCKVFPRCISLFLKRAGTFPEILEPDCMAYLPFCFQPLTECGPQQAIAKCYEISTWMNVLPQHHIWIKFWPSKNSDYKGDNYKIKIQSNPKALTPLWKRKVDNLKEESKVKLV